MSDAAVDPEEYALPEDGPVAPRWLRLFVRDNIRPLLLRCRETAQEALARWLACQDERKREELAWDARRLEFLRQMAALPEDQRDSPEPPAEGYTWAEPLVQLDDGRMVHIKCWLPVELRYDSKPATEYPLPPPSNRDLSPDECWAALIAVHDVCRIPREQIGPADSWYCEVLRRRALELTEAQLADLGAMLALARTILPAPPASLEERHQAEGIETRPKPGRPADTDRKADKRVADAWATGKYKTYQECANALGLTRQQVKNAIDRHRHRSRGKRRRRPPASE